MNNKVLNIPFLDLKRINQAAENSIFAAMQEVVSSGWFVMGNQVNKFEKNFAEYLLAHPNICSRKWVTEQYDSTVGTANRSTNRPSDAAVVRLRDPKKGDLNKAIVITVDCNGRYVNADPEMGCQIAVSEAARNIVCTGGEPIAITNNLNFGNPYNPEVYWSFVGAVQGMSKACLKFGTPVTGGNVSFYNQSSDDGPVFPTPTIGMLGLLENLENHTTLDFKNSGDLIYLIGASKNDIASSEYLYSYRKVKASPAPSFNLDEEHHLQEGVKALIQNKLAQSVHDISDGGLFVTLAESAIPRQLGFRIATNADFRTDAFLFGEAQSRVIISAKDSEQNQIENLLRNKNIDFTLIGSVTEENFVINDKTLMTCKTAKSLYENTIGDIMK